MEKVQQIYCPCIVCDPQKTNVNFEYVTIFLQFKNHVFISACRSCDVFHETNAMHCLHLNFTTCLIGYCKIALHPLLTGKAHVHLQPSQLQQSDVSPNNDFAFLVYLKIFQIMGSYNNLWGLHILDQLNVSLVCVMRSASFLHSFVFCVFFLIYDYLCLRFYEIIFLFFFCLCS